MTKQRTQIILKFMNIIFWIVFMGLCIKTNTILVVYFLNIFGNHIAGKNLYSSINFSAVYDYSRVCYSFTVFFLVLLTGLKTYIASLIIKIFLKFNFTFPFNLSIIPIINRIIYVALFAAVIAISASGYCIWLAKKGVIITTDWGWFEILFFTGVIYIIAEVFKRGITLQQEQDLTI